jgi:hypothetical protein
MWNKGLAEQEKEAEEEGRGFYRSAKSTLKSRTRKKLLERETWYKGDKKKDEADSDNTEKDETAHRDRDLHQERSNYGDKNNQKDEPKTSQVNPVKAACLWHTHW